MGVTGKERTLTSWCVCTSEDPSIIEPTSWALNKQSVRPFGCMYVYICRDLHFTSINQNAPQSRHNPARAGCNFCEGDTRGIQGGSLLAP